MLASALLRKPAQMKRRQKAKEGKQVSFKRLVSDAIVKMTPSAGQSKRLAQIKTPSLASVDSKAAAGCYFAKIESVGGQTQKLSE